ncbi:hypothetical protein H920_11301 [Fukomys damarensis]|uniref:Uncharacterized protein n=1 Tax=Fukomys damarensis TaxID=885580 RepID=A0A091DWX2_FUKDA|nr:hypothetical protein H920_11301 [Fukomys damarensis]
MQSHYRTSCGGNQQGKDEIHRREWHLYQAKLTCTLGDNAVSDNMCQEHDPIPKTEADGAECELEEMLMEDTYDLMVPRKAAHTKIFGSARQGCGLQLFGHSCPRPGRPTQLRGRRRIPSRRIIKEGGSLCSRMGNMGLAAFK